MISRLVLIKDYAVLCKMETEIFKPFPLASLVQVGSMGTIIRPNGRKASLKPDSVGYLKVTIVIGGVLTSFKQHRVIALTWVANPDALPEVNHKDGNKTNNAADNLEWISHADNIRHGRSLGLWKRQGGRPKGYKHSKQTIDRMRASKAGKRRDGHRGAWID